MDEQVRQAMREGSRGKIREILSTLRSAASQFKAEGHTDDEERCFSLILDMRAS